MNTNDIDWSIPPERIAAALLKIRNTVTPAMKAFLIYHIKVRGGEVPPFFDPEKPQNHTVHER